MTKTTEVQKQDRTQKQNIKGTTRQIVYVGMFTAVMAVLSQISIPMPTNVPVTLQTFAVAFTGAVLGWKLGTCSTLVYIMIGAIGAPVFAEFSGGFSFLVGYSGGFLYGFLFLACLSGIGGNMQNRPAGILTAIAGLALCHVCGAVQFAIVAGQPILRAFLLASVPYLIKDIISVILALALGVMIRKRLRQAGLME